MMATVFCTKCKKNKPKKDFFFRHNKGVYRMPCKACHKLDYIRCVVSKRPSPLMSLYADEVWMPIKGYVGLYDVSNYGNIRSYARGKNRGGIIILIVGITGYPRVSLCKDNTKKSFNVHSLVAKTFICNPKKLPVINHKNGIKTDNRVSNLEWCTYSYNVKHSYDIGLSVSKFGENHHLSKHKNSLILAVFNEVGTHLSIANKYGLSRRYVGQIKEGKIWSKITNKIYEKRKSNRQKCLVPPPIKW